jgi:DNA adenine methylase
MNPIIKWPGGKKNEYKQIKNFIPPYERYVEPFFGGGAIFFKEEPLKAAINDLNTLLMDFYKLVKEQDQEFKNQLMQFEYNWDNMDKFIKPIEDELIKVFQEYRTKKLKDKFIDMKVTSVLKDKMDEFNGIFDEDFAIDNDMMFLHILQAVTAKLKRMRKVEEQKGEMLSEGDLYKNIETGFRSGFYYHFRDLLNDCNLGRKRLPKEKHIAIFYYIREFCYGSMFRYNNLGEFNIPYGGISYNVKNFASKINNLFNLDIKELFSGAEIYNLDFELFLNSIDLNENDFVFFDPPYDTDFSTYGGNPFDKKDQERLAKVLYNLPARFILIIKNTNFIYNLYKDKKNIRISSFNKLYSYNVRGRNDRNAEHLVICNFE